MWVQSLGQEDPLEEGMATHSRILAWRIPCTEEPARLQSIGSDKESGMTERTQHAHTHNLISSPLFSYIILISYSYDYTVEVRNRFKGLDLIECLMNYGRRFVALYRRQGSRPYPKKEMKKSKMAVWGGLTNSCEKKRSEKQRRKGKI